MSKFKVGDRVMCVDPKEGTLLRMNDVYIITYINYFGSSVQVKNIDETFYSYRFELVHKLPRNYKQKEDREN